MTGKGNRSCRHDCWYVQVFLPVLLAMLFLPAIVSAQPVFVGLGGEHVTHLVAEQCDPGERWVPGTANLLYAAVKGGALHQGFTWDDSGVWRRLEDIAPTMEDVTALTVQHWGVGPRDGLFLLAAVRHDAEATEAGVLFRRAVDAFNPVGDAWVRADSGILRGDTATIVYALAAFYYTGHTPPQAVLGWTGLHPLRGGAGGVFWEQGAMNGRIALAMDVTPKWFGRHAWAAGQSAQGVGEAALYRSTDQGESWQERRITYPIPAACSAVAACPGSPDTVAVVCAGTLYLSRDAGVTLDEAFRLSAAHVTSVVFDPLYPTHLYAATDGMLEVYRSTDLGARWHKLAQPSPLPSARVTCMTMAMMDTVPMGRPPRRGLFLGTTGAGVWRYDVDMIVQHAGPPGERPAELRLHMQPNPATTSTEIRLSGAAAGPVVVALRDMLGRTLLQRTLHADSEGQARGILDVAALPSGVYVLHAPGAPHGRPLLLRVLR
ncbi:MAG: hypothetical protein M5R41_02980 [Bacteroidia bacterium]|nr:hypothetical protein [Bacteroidia bacterium]